jgi:hypothetical protein
MSKIIFTHNKKIIHPSDIEKYIKKLLTNGCNADFNEDSFIPDEVWFIIFNFWALLKWLDRKKEVMSNLHSLAPLKDREGLSRFPFISFSGNSVDTSVIMLLTDNDFDDENYMYGLEPPDPNDVFYWNPENSHDWIIDDKRKFLKAMEYEILNCEMSIGMHKNMLNSHNNWPIGIIVMKAFIPVLKSCDKIRIFVRYRPERE